MAKTNTNPEVRFAGFSENWEERELSKILTERKVMQKITEDSPILAFAAGQGVIDRSERKSNNRDHLTHDQENKIYKLTELDDIVYNPSNLKYGAIDRNKHGRGVISPIYVTFTTEEEPSFIELLVKSEKFKLKALQYEEGTVVKRQSVKPENLLSLKVSISPSKLEQNKIGDFFCCLEKMITENQNKYDNLKKIKEAMLNKMFPVKDAKVLEVRFNGFSKNWNKCCLGAVVSIKSGCSPSTFSIGDKLFIKVNDLNSSVREQNDSYLKVSQNSSITMIKKGSIIFPKRGGAIMTNKVRIMGDSGYMDSNMMALEPLEVDSDFLFLYIYKTGLYKIADTSTVPQINNKHIEPYLIQFPQKDEQKRIGEYFRNMDNLIIQYQLQLAKLNTIIKACFAKMTSASSKHFEYNN